MRIYKVLRGICALGLFVTLIFVEPAAAKADTVADFYKDHRLTIIVGFSPGGGIDTYARLLGRHYGKHVPGNPPVVVLNMPGAGGIKALNYLYNIAPKDGTHIATMSSANPLDPVMGGKGARFDTFKFEWIGNMATDSPSCVFSAKSPLRTFDDIFKREAVLGATGTGAITAQHAYALRNVLGAKIRVVTGYPSTPAIWLAMANGEVDGACSFWVSLVLGPKANDVKAGKLRPLVQMGPRKAAAFGDAPLVFDYAKTPEDRAVLKFIFGQTEATRPFTAPPGVPADRLAALRKAFMATMKDPDLLAEAKKARLLIGPMDGKQTEATFRAVLSAPKPVVERAKRAIRE